MSIGSFITVAVTAALLAGCDGGSPRASAPSTNPTNSVSQRPATEPVTVTFTEPPATAPATEPGMASLTIGQKGFWFPKAILRLSNSQGHLVARLSTDDPPAAIDENYHGNSFDLNMPLPVPDAAQLDGADWKFTLPSGQKADTSPHGIYLDGQRRCLHPQDVAAHFQRAGDSVAVQLSGWFLLYETAATDRAFQLPKRVWVQGALDATVETR